MEEESGYGDDDPKIETLLWNNNTIFLDEAQNLLYRLSNLTQGTCTPKDVIETSCVKISLCDEPVSSDFSTWQIASVCVSIAVIFIIMFWSGTQNKAKKLHKELFESLYDENQPVDKIPLDPYKEDNEDEV